MINIWKMRKLRLGVKAVLTYCAFPLYILKILPPFKNGKVNLFKKNG
jgi:hypothetical protein